MLACEYFDPVVDDWNEEAQERELQERESCGVCLYVLTPKMSGVYSVAEVVDDSNKRPEKTVFCVLSVDDGLTFTPEQEKSLGQVRRLVAENGARVFDDLEQVAEYCNGR